MSVHQSSVARRSSRTCQDGSCLTSKRHGVPTRQPIIAAQRRVYQKLPHRSTILIAARSVLVATAEASGRLTAWFDKHSYLKDQSHPDGYRPGLLLFPWVLPQIGHDVCIQITPTSIEARIPETNAAPVIDWPSGTNCSFSKTRVWRVSQHLHSPRCAQRSLGRRTGE